MSDATHSSADSFSEESLSEPAKTILSMVPVTAGTRRRFKTWKDVDGSKRRDLLLKLADLLEQNRDELAKVESARRWGQDTGTCIAPGARGSEVKRV